MINIIIIAVITALQTGFVVWVVRRVNSIDTAVSNVYSFVNGIQERIKKLESQIPVINKQHNFLCDIVEKETDILFGDLKELKVKNKLRSKEIDILFDDLKELKDKLKQKGSGE